MELVENTMSGNATSAYDENPALFWAFATLYLVIALLTVIGNGLVIAATYITERNDNQLQQFVNQTYFVKVIKSLAFSDMFYGLLGAPFQIYGYYLGE